ncbi:GntR family transcriptional regulator [Bacillus sp. JCM 19034]|uniref:GntR family transcriptional regulator n=1 Tax=Bacillus sp. JCM 19034 TaxID=1481928 RepID=UPI000782FAAA|nr:GntR family transcriptional regulator [Bacillus sp. JCM 19034]
MATTESLADKAYQQLRDKIVYGELLPEVVLSENELSKEMNMSRTPIRTALSRLASEGFVVTFKNLGILVKDTSNKELLDIAALNDSMKNYAVDLAADGLITFDIDKLKYHLNLQLEATEAENYIEYVEQSILFGRAMIEASNNQIMIETYDSLRLRTLRSAILRWKRSPNEKHYSANDYNLKLLRAIEQKPMTQLK